MPEIKKGLLIQFFGLPNSGKSSRSTILYEDLKQKHEVSYMGNLGGFSLERIIEKPFFYYEFDLLEQEKEIYTKSEKITENRLKLIDEITTYKEIFENQIKPLLDEDKIVIGYNPISQNILNRFGVVEKNSFLMEKSLNKIEKFHSNYNCLNFYLDVLPNQIIARQPENYEESIIEKKIHKEHKRRLVSELGNNFDPKKIKQRLTTDFENLLLIKGIYQTPKVLDYFKKTRTVLLDYAKTENIDIIQNDINKEIQNEMINFLTTKRLKTIYNQPKSL